MSDLISRGALFNACANLHDKGEIFAAIQAAPAVDRWISAEDQLPDLEELKSDWVIGIVN